MSGLLDEDYDRRLMARMRRDMGRTDQPGWNEQRDTLLDVGGQMARGAFDLVVPQTPLDIGLTLATGPVGSMARRAAIAGAGYLLDPNEAQADSGVLRRVSQAAARAGTRAAGSAAEAPAAAPAAAARRRGTIGVIPAEAPPVAAPAGPAARVAPADALPDVSRVDDWTGEDFSRYGRQYGVDNLGPASNADWQASLRPYQTPDGRTITVPGGHDAREPFTYYDLAHLQAQGINPNDLPDEIHRGIHNRVIRTMTPGRDLEPHEVFNQLAFAQVSPNQPLTPNLFASQAVDAKNPALTGPGPTDMDRWAERIPWRYNDPNPPTVQQRQAQSQRITSELGIQAAERGGSGVSGNADYTNIAELAQMMRDNPDFFRFRGAAEAGDTDAQRWGSFVERLMNQTRGLSAKTGSFGAVWQAPEQAQISAMDRHMAGLLSDDVFSTASAQNALERRGRSFAEERGLPPEQAPRSRAEFEAIPGGRGEFIDVALGQIGNLPSATFRNARTGDINPRVPEHLRERVGGTEPDKVFMLGNAYQRGLDANAARAATTPGLDPGSMQSTFANQWMLWDRARNRLDPHLMRFPGLDRLPRMDRDLMAARKDNYGAAGYFNQGGSEGLPPTRAMRTPGSAAYWTAAPAAIGLGAGGLLDHENQ